MDISGHSPVAGTSRRRRRRLVSKDRTIAKPVDKTGNATQPRFRWPLHHHPQARLVKPAFFAIATAIVLTVHPSVIFPPVLLAQENETGGTIGGSRTCSANRNQIFCPPTGEAEPDPRDDTVTWKAGSSYRVTWNPDWPTFSTVSRVDVWLCDEGDPWRCIAGYVGAQSQWAAVDFDVPLDLEEGTYFVAVLPSGDSPSTLSQRERGARLRVVSEESASTPETSEAPERRQPVTETTQDSASTTQDTRNSENQGNPPTSSSGQDPKHQISIVFIVLLSSCIGVFLLSAILLTRLKTRTKSRSSTGSLQDRPSTTEGSVEAKPGSNPSFQGASIQPPRCQGPQDIGGDLTNSASFTKNEAVLIANTFKTVLQQPLANSDDDDDQDIESMIEAMGMPRAHGRRNSGDTVTPNYCSETEDNLTPGSHVSDLSTPIIAGDASVLSDTRQKPPLSMVMSLPTGSILRDSDHHPARMQLARKRTQSVQDLTTSCNTALRKTSSKSLGAWHRRCMSRADVSSPHDSLFLPPRARTSSRLPAQTAIVSSDGEFREHLPQRPNEVGAANLARMWYLARDSDTILVETRRSYETITGENKSDTSTVTGTPEGHGFMEVTDRWRSSRTLPERPEAPAPTPSRNSYHAGKFPKVTQH